jgi:hypothetical protein
MIQTGPDATKKHPNIRLKVQKLNECTNKPDQLRPVIPRFEKVGPKPLHMWPGCLIHTYSNNTIHMQCSIKHNKYSLHNDSWVLKNLHKYNGN